MSKLLVIGDVHIFSYSDYNLETNFRLNQFESLAQRLIEIARDYDCSKLAIAGDLLHKAVLSPLVANTVKNFFNILSAQFSKNDIWLIYGNHDVNSKNQEIDYQDSTLLAFDEFFTYSDKQIFSFEGRKVALANWRPVQDLGFIDDKVDLFIGHVTIDERFGQEIDNSKFTLGLAGDIHHIVSKNNLHSINVPIPHYISDEQVGSVVVYDPVTNDFERVITESPSFKHLKIYYEDSNKADFTDFLTMKVRKPTKVQSADYVHRSIDLDQIISQVVNQANLNDIHTQYLSKISNLESKPIDLNFSIKYLKIKNFLSIKELELDLANGLVMLSGKNGNGKSSLIRAIDFVLRPPRQAKDFIKIGEKSLSIEIELDYANRTHKIIRSVGSSSSVNYILDGVEQVASSITELNKAIEENLTFLQLFDILYRYQSAPYLLSGFNYAQRIDLVSKLLGLGKIESYHKAITADFKAKKLELTELISQYDTKSSLISYLLPQNVSKAKSIDLLASQYETLTQEQKRLESDWVRFKTINDTNQKLNQENEQKQRERETLLDRLSTLNEQLNSYPSKAELLKQIDEGHGFLLEMQTGLESKTSKLKKLNSEKAMLQAEIDSVEKGLSSINLNSKACSSCGREFDNAQEIQQHYDSIAEKLANVTAKNQGQIYTILENIKELEQDERKSRAVVSEIEKTLYDMKAQGKAIDEVEEKIKDLTSKLSQYPEQIAEKLEIIDLSDLVQKRLELTNKVAEAKAELDIAKEQASKLRELERLQAEFEELENQLSQANSELERLEQYKELFHSTGSIVKSVFMTVAELLTEDQFVVRTVKNLKNGETKIDFDIDYLVNGTLIPYQNLSGGQKVIVDIFFLAKLFKMSGQVGLLMLDETLKDLDTDNLDKAVTILKNSPISTLLLVTHVESFNHYDLKYNVENVQGNSVYKLEG